jgi:hypothetical protein
VQRDYLYGWLLAGLYGDNPLMRDRLVLKDFYAPGVALAGRWNWGRVAR